MNSHTTPTRSGRPSDYLASLDLPPDDAEVLAQETDFIELHRRLAGQQAGTADDALDASIARRLALGAGPEVADSGLLGTDSEGRTVLAAAPPVRRTRMIPEPWRTNILVRVWRRLTGRKNRPAPPRRQLEPARWRQVGSWRRMVLLILMLGQTSVATWYMNSILPYQGWSLIKLQEVTQQSWEQSLTQVLPYLVQGSILVLFSILFCWVSAGFWTALMGFWELRRGYDRYGISGRSAGDAPIPAEARTAIIMPICNEDVPRVFAGLRATYESLAAKGELEHFDFFVLSDTGDADIAVAEQRAWLELCRETQGFGRIFYRRRRRRVKRKSGNIDDFCRRWGSDYRYMVVLDADSVMSGHSLASLVRLMEQNPQAGIIQTAPVAVGMNTLYARLQQFATRAYGPLFTAGLHFWQLGESHYWGHNAIIRMQPFIDHCALAPLPGKGAFAGAILSHDFVEASLMRRAGWGVWIAYDLPGSYEELPPNLIDELQRDRRWCHGNLMNFRLFLVKGMHPVHRAVFLTGVMSYLSAPLWFLFLVLSTALLAVHTLMEPQYFLVPGQLFPVWPQWNPEKAIALFSTTLTLLFLPKLLSIVLIWLKGAREFGGAFKVTLSMLLEMVFSVLLAPVRMLFHTQFVTAAFLGWSVKWNSPQRDNGLTTWGDATRRHGWQSLLGLGWAAGVAWLDPNFLWWLAPIVVSLMLVIPVSVISSRLSLGLRSRDSGLFLIPEEYQPPQELVSTYAYARENRENALENGFVQAVLSPYPNALACAMATARHGHAPLLEQARQRLVEHALKTGPDKLDATTRLTLLSDPVMLTRLHRQLWQQPAQHPLWGLHAKPLETAAAAVPVHDLKTLAPAAPRHPLAG
ncbi:glucans biosynthesis glucosyltransferase MdoH [Pseudomonas sp. GD03944]|uniref:glucans biosynthesis glucosyltransferase MdoH n=1 Tax=Pseudomonas sp. GD03944 TaxID=2975409 RepID=UPI00244ABBCC|nr:glucans biosynthesis glucosyltransferase MdoH [Pseudomonas sp. GD03944]MDH1264398.1 glucans biosynthesis glucosyltransferase MdoH [Pseudomonas sp. GD03944]